MSLLVAGCSLSSGWGFDDPAKTWPSLVSKHMGLDLINVARTSASNQDIFLSAMHTQDQDYELRLIQWTALNRITVSPSPVDSHVILSVHDQFLADALPGVSHSELQAFVKVLTMLNQDWKPYFDLVAMVEILQKDPRTYFVNGLLPWNIEFFSQDWTVPLSMPNHFLESLLQVENFGDDQLQPLLTQVMRARDRMDLGRWINLAPSWNSEKIDVVSDTDSHPGPLSQIKYADAVVKYIMV